MGVLEKCNRIPALKKTKDEMRLRNKFSNTRFSSGDRNSNILFTPNAPLFNFKTEKKSQFRFNWRDLIVQKLKKSLTAGFEDA